MVRGSWQPHSFLFFSNWATVIIAPRKSACNRAGERQLGLICGDEVEGEIVHKRGWGDERQITADRQVIGVQLAVLWSHPLIFIVNVLDVPQAEVLNLLAVFQGADSGNSPVPGGGKVVYTALSAHDTGA